MINMPYEERTYRNLITRDKLLLYNVKIGESDLFISSEIDLSNQIKKSLSTHRSYLENYIKKRPQFLSSLLPLPEDNLAPAIVRDMLAASSICQVGPMSSVAGAVAQAVGLDIAPYSDTLIIENGGDIFLKSADCMTVSVFAGKSPLSYKVKFTVKTGKKNLGICTSSASVGPSFSFGKADAVCVISDSATLSDAAATAVGNKVKSRQDIKPALDFGITIKGVNGVIIIFGNEMGAIGEIQLI